MKTKKIRISKNKRNNIKRNTLARQGKLKGKRHKTGIPKQKPQKPAPVIQQPCEEDENDVMDMLDEEELEYIKTSVNNKTYRILKQVGQKKEIQEDNIEEKYEKCISEHLNQNEEVKEVRFMLPIKTKEGRLQNQVIEKTVDNNNEIEEEQITVFQTKEKKEEDEENEIAPKTLNIESEPISVAKLLATREQILQSRKFQIGIMCSQILENPELNIKKLEVLTKFLTENNPEIYITVRKLAIASLLEVFKDILPSYHLIEKKQDDVILKQSTLKLQNYELTLLKYYKKYLQCLEKTAKLLKKSYQSEELHKRTLESKLAILAISSMGEMLVTHPYFNFSANIVNFLIPLLDCKLKEVREIVMKTFSQVFKEDMRAELSLQMVKSINKYIKQHKHCVHPEILQVLLALKIKDIDLEKEKQEETKKKKLEAHKKRIVNLSKKERKRKKQLVEVEKELLEAQAEENKQSKHKNLTEITNILFTIYFRILKQAPGSKVLSVCLEGLAKFTHCISIEYYQDIVNCLSTLLESGTLGLRERLNCVSTVFTVLSGYGSHLNIDPRRFYCYLFKDLYEFTTSKNNSEIQLLVKVLSQAIIDKHKSIEVSRLIGFLKRISTVSLSFQHNGILAILGIVKKVMQLGSKARILLDTENIGDGIYLPELEEPEYSNAHCTSLYELSALQRHYHSTVRSIANNVAWEVPTSGRGSIPPELSKM